MSMVCQHVLIGNLTRHLLLACMPWQPHTTRHMFGQVSINMHTRGRNIAWLFCPLECLEPLWHHRINVRACRMPLTTRPWQRKYPLLCHYHLVMHLCHAAPAIPFHSSDRFTTPSAAVKVARCVVWAVLLSSFFLAPI
jgi:hypothetical protein